MSFNLFQGAYGTGGLTTLAQAFQASRNPTANDINFPIGQQWLNTSTKVTWQLYGFSTTTGATQADWQSVGGKTGDVNSLTGDDGVAVDPDASGNINVIGATVATATNTKAVFTKNTAVNTLTAQVQVGSAISSANIASSGLLSMNSAMATVDPTGFTSIIGNVQSDSGDTVDLTISNLSNTNASDAALIIQTANTASGDPYLQLNVGGNTRSYALGIDNIGGSNDLVLQYGTSPITPNTGSNALSVNSSGVVDFTNAPVCPLITIQNLPVIGTDGCNKTYVDSVATGFTVLTPAIAATTADLNATYDNGVSGVGATLTNAGALAAFSTDGVSPAINSRILVKNQTAEEENGVYSLTTVGSGAVAWVLTRTTDYDTVAQIKPGTFIIVQQGTAQANTAWVQYETVVTIGTDPINFAEFGISITFPIDIAEGGTNATSMANTNGINYYDGTRIVTAPSLTDGQLLIGNTGNPPTASTLTAGAGVTIVNAPGAITISSSSAVGTMVDFQYTQTSSQAIGGNTFFPLIGEPSPLNVTNTDGTQIFSLSITPKSATNLLRIQANIYAGASNAVGVGLPFGIALFQNSTVNALFASSSREPSGGLAQPILITMDYIMVAGTTSPITFNLRGGVVEGTGPDTWFLNSVVVNVPPLTAYGIYVNTISTFSITEIAQ